MSFEQYLIIVFSGTGALLIAIGDGWEKWGKLSCLIASPLWIVSAAGAAQWGMFLMTIWVSCTYVLGVFRHWRRGDYPWYRLIACSGCKGSGKIPEPICCGNFVEDCGPVCCGQLDFGGTAGAPEIDCGLCHGRGRVPATPDTSSPRLA